MTEKPSHGMPIACESESKAKWMVCPVCGQHFDCRDLMQVLDHWHEDAEVEIVETWPDHQKKLMERYAKKIVSHINWLRTLPPLESANVRRRDVLRQCLVFREMIRSGDEIPGLPAVDYLRSAQQALLLIRRIRVIARRSLH
jgi:hypothetical protein